MALGVALFARAVDLPSVTSQALDAAWLALVGHVLCRTLLLRCADAVESGAGTRRLDRLGGLIHRMPVTAGSCLVGLFAHRRAAARSRLCRVLAAVPVAARHGPDRRSWSAGAGRRASPLWPRCRSAWRHWPRCGCSAWPSSAVPRTPRAAVADDAPRPVRLVLGGLAAATALLGLLPGLALLPAAGWTRRGVAGVADPAHRRRDAGLFAHCRGWRCSPWPGSSSCGVHRADRRTATRAGVVRRFRRTAVMAAVRRSGDAVRARFLRRAAASALLACCRRLRRSRHRPGSLARCGAAWRPTALVAP